MSKSFIISDTHFGHRNIIKFEDDSGNIIRNFSTLEEHDECLINNWNEKIKEGDRVYHLGDFCINRQMIKIRERLNGRICLIKGNHDIFKLKDYIPYFDDIRAYKFIPKLGLILSHVPLHERQFQGIWKGNVHGHIHANLIDDKRYMNVCVEQTNYYPLSLDEIVEEYNKRGIRLGNEQNS